MSARATVEIPADHPAFAGHFPAFPVLPGAVLLDEALHIVAAERGIDLTHWRIAGAKFPAVVRPGDTLQVEHHSPKPDLIQFTVRVGERQVAAASLTRMTPAETAA